MKVTISELYTFINIVDKGTISKASEHLDITVSAASRSLSKLEKKLNTTLFSRNTRRLELTYEGTKYLSRVRGVLDELEAAEEMLIQRKEIPSGKLRIDAATPFMFHVIIPLIDKYCKIYPQVEIELTNNENWIDLLEQRADIAIRIGALKDSTLTATSLGLSQRRIVASPGYLKRYGTPQSIDDLSNHQLLGFSSLEKLNYWPIYDRSNNLLRIEANIKADSGETLRQLALCDTGIICLSDFVTSKDVQAGRLVPLFTANTVKIEQPINIVYYKNGPLSKRVSSFIEFLKQEVDL